MSNEPVMAFGSWANNAEMIADCARLGYLRSDAKTLDPTWGLGRFYSLWRPDELIASDLDPERSPVGYSIDFTKMPFPDGFFDQIILDPPYKLNGTGGSHASDEAYGVAGTYESWQSKHQLICDGITECTRVLKPKGMLLVKCQAQVCSGQIRWQPFIFTAHAETLGHRLVDMLHIPSYRAQPPGRTQIHSRQNYSTLLVLRLEHS